MEPLTVGWLRNIIQDMPDDVLVIVNGGQGNKNPAWSIESGQDKDGNEVLEIIY
jgi:hypothetical protein